MYLPGSSTIPRLFQLYLQSDLLATVHQNKDIDSDQYLRSLLIALEIDLCWLVLAKVIIRMAREHFWDEFWKGHDGKKRKIRRTEKSCDPCTEIAQRDSSCAFLPWQQHWTSFLPCLSTDAVFTLTSNLFFWSVPSISVTVSYSPGCLAYFMNEAIPLWLLVISSVSVCTTPATPQNSGHCLKLAFPCCLPHVWTQRHRDIRAGRVQVLS